MHIAVFSLHSYFTPRVIFLLIDCFKELFKKIQPVYCVKDEYLDKIQIDMLTNLSLLPLSIMLEHYFLYTFNNKLKQEQNGI